MWLYVILSAALVSTIMYIVYDWRKNNNPAASKVEAKSRVPKGKWKIAEKLHFVLNSGGLAFHYIIRLFISILPLIMIGADFGLTFLFCLIMNIIPLASPVFWIWGLVRAVTGTQDWMTIVYYICFGIIFLPFMIDLLLQLFSRVASNVNSSRSRTAEATVKKEDTAKAARREALAQADDITDELLQIYKVYASKLSSKFKFFSDNVYDNAKAAAPSFLFVLSRILLISHGILTQQPTKASKQIDCTVYDLLSTANSREVFDACLVYYHTFLPPRNALPRCDVFLLDDSIFKCSDDSFLRRLYVAYGDCIVNPALITDGPDAPVSPLGMFEMQGIGSTIICEVPPLIDDFADSMLIHFSKHIDYYQV